MRLKHVKKQPHSTTKIKTIYPILFFLLLMPLHSLHAQNLNLGLSTGMMSGAGIFEKPIEPSFSFGLVTAYQPAKAQFSLTAEPIFLHFFDALMIPVSANLKPGNRVKLRLSAGLFPFIRFKTEKPDKTIELGHKLSAGLDIRISPSMRIFGEIGRYRIPNLEYHYSHFGNRDIDKQPIDQYFYRIGIYRELHLLKEKDDYGPE